MSITKEKNLTEFKDILISDFTITRAQIRASEEWHVKISLTFTISVILMTGALLKIDPDKVAINKPGLFGLINLVVIAQISFLLKYHFFYIQLWTKYVVLIESKIKLLFRGCDLIEFESVFAPLYFKSFTNKLLTLFIHLPSLAIYGYGTYRFSEQFDNYYFKAGGYGLFVVLIAILLIFYIKSPESLIKKFEEKKEASKTNFSEWLKEKGYRS